jgi:hypothetical protein
MEVIVVIRKAVEYLSFHIPRSPGFLLHGLFSRAAEIGTR